MPTKSHYVLKGRPVPDTAQGISHRDSRVLADRLRHALHHPRLSRQWRHQPKGSNAPGKLATDLPNLTLQLMSGNLRE